MLKFTFAFLFFFFNSIFAFSQYDFSENLVAHYPFNGNANDTSGHSFNGAVHGATLTTDRFNKQSAFDFDGVDDYIFVTYDEAFDLSDSLTISCWINGSSLSNGEYSFLSKLGNGIAGYDISISYNVMKFQTTNGGIPTGYVDATGPSIFINDDQWYQLVVVYSVKTGKLQFYIDGELYQEFQKTEPLSKSVGYGLYIGHRELSGISNYFSGKIDDLRIYNCPLTPEQVEALYNEEKNSTITAVNHSIQQSSINIYPNPITESVTIAFGESESKSLKIFDSQGSLIYFNETSTEESIDSRNWPTGIYFFQITAKNNTRTFKMLKQ